MTEEKQDKTVIKEYNSVIYPRYLWIATGDIKEVMSKFEYDDGEPLKCKEKGFFGVTFGYVCNKEREKLGVLVYFRHTEGLSHAVHEAVHAANKIFRDLNITFNFDEDEHYAYFVSWIVSCIEDFFKESQTTGQTSTETDKIQISDNLCDGKVHKVDTIDQVPSDKTLYSGNDNKEGGHGWITR